MGKIPPRIIIYTRDIENITGRKRRTAHAIMQKIKAYFGKEDCSFITISEFCYFMKIEEELVREFLVD
jgi:hypothetical protein